MIIKNYWYRIDVDTLNANFAYTYNTFASPALNGLSLFQLTYGANQQEGTFGSFKEYSELLWFAYFQKIVQDYSLQ